MNEEKEYQTKRVNEPKKVVRFLVKYLGFFDDQGTEKKHTEKHVVKLSNRFGDNYLLVQGSYSNISDQNIDKIITFHTDNCLRDYHQLKSAGIKIEQIPRYTARGLEVIFSDPCGNHYLLLEERDYSES
jgi:hypothetical protein